MIGQYADDTFLLLDGTERSLRLAMGIFDQFRKCSGLKMNVDKTKAVWLGVGARDKLPLCPDLNIQWSRNFDLLGIKFNVDEMEDILSLNLQGKIKDIKKLMNSYKKRNLTIMGKITVVKTMAVSKLIHILSVLPTPNKHFFKKINAIFSEFIWNSKTGKVCRNLLAQDKCDGGLSLTHIATLADALKVKWIKDILQSKEGWASIFVHCAGRQYNSYMWQLDQRSLVQIKTRMAKFNPFWNNVIDVWAKLVGKAEEPSEILNYSFESAWYIANRNIKKLQPVLYGCGIHLIRDVIDKDGKLLSYQEFRRIYNININYMDFLSLRNSIPRTWLREIQALGTLQESRETELVLALKKAEKVCKWAYGELLKNLNIKEPYKAKWSNILNEVGDDEWKHYHSSAFRCTKNTKLQAFQFKILHHILATQKMLKLYKISETDSCTFCGNSVETIEHLLFNCPQVRTVWDDLATWFMPVSDISDLITERNVLLGSFSNDLINLIFLLAKYHIYSCKFRATNPHINGIKACIKQEYLIEIRIAKKDANQLRRTNAKWGTVCQLLNET